MQESPSRSPLGQRFIGALIAGLGLIAFAVPATAERASEDMIGIRCVGYEAALPHGACCGFYAPNDAAFDIYISPSRSAGWWDGAVTRIDREHPAKLEMNPAEYRLDATLGANGDRWSEWIVINRIVGTVSHYAQRQGSQAEQLKRGGMCSKMEPRF